MLLVLVILVLALLIICCFTPGFYFVRRCRWTPLEKLCGSVGLSLILLYLAAWTVYCFGPRDERLLFRMIVVAAILAGVPAARDAVRLLCSFRIRRALAGFGFLLLFVLAMLSMIRVYSGAGWMGDWYEHFQRCLFFLQRLPARTPIYPSYPLPARPPMMNVLGALFLGAVGDRFPLFQVIFGFLNTLLFLPALLLLPAIGDARRRGAFPLVVLLAANASFMVNATYSWTKLLAVFYVLLAFGLYLSGWRKRDPLRTGAAFVALAAGFLVHYSAGPYLVFLALHYAWRFCRERPLRWREPAGIAIACGLLLASWFAWSVRTYGVRTTFASNTSVTSSRQYEGSDLEKVALNLYDSIVPGWARGEEEEWPQGNPEGSTRDTAFEVYQLNLILAMGSAGGLLVLWLLYARLIRGKAAPERVFWRIMVPFCVVLGIAVVGERDVHGVPHLTLLSVEALGLILLAANFGRLWPVARFLLIAACCVDFYFGVWLQAHIESLENTPAHIVFPDPQFVGGSIFTNGSDLDALSGIDWQNWRLKHRAVNDPRWIEELPRGHESDPWFQAAWPHLRADLQGDIDDDLKNWDGWAARHGGVQYLGDWVAGASGKGIEIAGWVLSLLFAGVIGLLARQAWVRQPAA